MNQIDKLIADAKAVTNGDYSRVDLMWSRIEDTALDAAVTIRDALFADDATRELHGISLLTGMAWLLGGLMAMADQESGNTKNESLTTIRQLIEAGYDDVGENP